MSLSNLPDPEFFDRAACRGEDPELFFPVSEDGLAAQRQIAAAQEVCHRCVVQVDCLSWALSTGQSHGIWGGMTEDDRRDRTRRKRQEIRA